MATIGLMVLPVPGHLNPATSLARTLQDRGHKVIVFGVPDAKDTIVRGGLTYRMFGEKYYPEGDVKSSAEALGELTGVAQLRYISSVLALVGKVTLEELPNLIKTLNIDVMIVDEFQPGAATACEHAKVPFAVISNALTLSPDPAIPSAFMAGGPATSYFDRAKNRLFHTIVHFLVFRSCNLILKQVRSEWGLKPISRVWDEHLGHLHITQEPKEFSFPRDIPKKNLHFLGPFHDTRRGTSTEFPWEKLNGKPLIYASMGTLQNQLIGVFRTISAACKDEEAQLVISLGGGGLLPEELGQLEGEPIVVGFAPQLELLDHATACITHAGLNTTLECLARGVPMVALPVGSDQPAVASRIEFCGAGINLNTPSPDVKSLKNAIHSILTEKKYSKSAKSMAKNMDPTKARARAAMLVEGLLRKEKRAI